MQEQEPQVKATEGNATERLQIRYLNSRCMKEKVEYPGLIPGTNLVRVPSSILALNENTDTLNNRETPKDNPSQNF